MNTIFRKSVRSLIGILIFFGILICMFIIGEIVVRLIYKDSTVMMPRYTTSARYGEYTIRRIKPNIEFTHTTIDGSWRFTTNSRGFRNYKNFEYAKPKDVTRVVCLGDSHTQGYEAEQEYTFSAVIEKYLEKKSINAEVINTGVSGFGTAEHLVLLENEMIKYSPDYIVLAFFANDFSDNIRSGIYGIDEYNKLVVRKKIYIPGVKLQNIIYSIPGVMWLSENSYFYSLLFNHTWSFFKSKLSAKSKKEIQERAIAAKDKFSDYEKRLALLLLKKIYEVSKNAGAKLIIVDIPRTSEKTKIAPSIDDDFTAAVQEHCDFFISAKVLDDYNGVVRLHVPHGHRHISEFTHSFLGVEIAKYIVDDLK